VIKIIDYGLGNIQAFCNVYKRLNIEVSTAQSADDLRTATKLILPGVGAFDHAIGLLDKSGMRDTLDELVLGKHIPVLGVCVGMQILAHSSDEGKSPGLGWVDAHVKHIKSLHEAPLPLPHMGWNDVRPAKSSSNLFNHLDSGARFYFLHSYYVRCDRPVDVAAVCSYQAEFPCAVSVGNIHGVQFHPEKSHHFGSRLLRNFAEF
jgi:imidazole glycerol-phosphate synthase subunit HisH